MGTNQPIIPLNLSIAEAIEKVADYIKPFDELKDIYHELIDIVSDAKEPLMLVVTGEFKTGKSTFINTLLGQEILKVDVTPATAVVTKISCGNKPGLIAHFKDGAYCNYPLSKLASLSSEGDTEADDIRQKLNHLDVVLPNKILNQYTIVDTPGLNSVYDYHTKATQQFISRADLVFWIFSLSNVGSKTEIASIKSLGEELKPIAVINRIDELDPEEDDLDDLLDNFRNRLGDSVRNVVGVSSLKAQQAKKNNNHEELAESRWDELIYILNRESGGNTEVKKCSRLLARLAKALLETDSIMIINEKRYKDAYDTLHGKGLWITNLEKQKEMQAQIKLWIPKKNEKTSFYQRKDRVVDRPNPY